MIALGVDPGRTGGLASVEMRGGVPFLLGAMRMPIVAAKSKVTLDARTFLDFVYKGSTAVIENVHAMPKQGVSSSFQFGRMFGAIEACCYESCERVTYVEPGTWKRKLGLGSVKQASRDLASRTFGQDMGKKFWPLAKDDGVAEAALIAYYHLKSLT